MYSPLVVYYPPLLSPEFLVLLLEWANKWDSSHGESRLRLSLDTPTGFVSNYFAYDSKTQDFGLLMISTRKDGFDSQLLYDSQSLQVKLLNLRSDTAVLAYFGFNVAMPNHEFLSIKIRFKTILWIVQYHLRVTTKSYIALKQTIR